MATSPSYTKNTWADDDPSKPLSAARMNNLEAQADAAYTDAVAADTSNLNAAKAYTDSKLTDSGWLTLTPISGYQATSTVQYRLIGNRVQMRGALIADSGNITAAVNAIATVPSGFRPTAAAQFTGPGINVAYTKISISTAGVVDLAMPSGTTTYARFDIVTYLND